MPPHTNAYRHWLAEHCPAPITAIDPVRSGPASDVLAVQTESERLYFKTCRGPAAHEAALMAALARLAADAVPDVVAVDADRGWLLMRDAGPQIRQIIRETGSPEPSAAMMRVYARLQQATAPEADSLLALGVPDRRLDRLPALYATLIADENWLLVGEPDGVSREDLARLQTFDLEALCRPLQSLGIPATLHHDDFHSGNAGVSAEGQIRLFDWGESVITHPLLGLLIPLRDARYTLGYADDTLEPITAAYLAAWAAYASPNLLRDALPAAHRLAALSRALSWQAVLRVANDATRTEDGEAVPYWLLTCLNGSPLAA